MRVFFHRAWRVCMTLLLVCSFAACAGDLPESKDARPPIVDHGPVWDLPQAGDAWTVPEAWVFPDLYAGAPFGCESDADCFGQLCCPTPWNVRVCVDFCGAD